MTREPEMAAETNERIATLESQMVDVRSIMSKREEYQSSVLEKLTEIKFKQDQFLDYQKTCDASREAHGKRIGALEDKWKALRAQAALIVVAWGVVLALFEAYEKSR